jgi:hypothetical protein
VKHLEVLFLRFYCQLPLPPRPFSPFLPQGKVQPINDWPTLCPDQCNGMGEGEIRWKVVGMTVTDDGFLEIPPVATQNLWT